MTDRTHVLRADLSAGTVERERVPERWRRRFLGGKGLGARYLYAELGAGADPLGPENLLAFCVGPLSGSLPGEPRYALVTKSPLTGLFLDSYGGGTFPARLAGSLEDCLALVVTGMSEAPVTVTVEGGRAEIDPATTWGADTVETDAAHPDAAVACAGPAGERGVRYATVTSDAGDHHAGRGGAGAVMGAKRLKAVVAAGPPAEPASTQLARLREEYADRYAGGDVGRWQAAGGTLESIDFADEVGALATDGWRSGRFGATADVGVDVAKAGASGRERSADAVPGGFRFETDAGDTVPRGATTMTFGAGLGVNDFDAVVALGEQCDRLGLDVIEAGNAVAWVARANEADVVDTGVEFGDPVAARALVSALATDESDGFDADLLAALRHGIDIASARYGFEPIPTVKSMALPGYDPRAAAGMALAYATSDRGGCHRRARPIETEVFEAWDDADRVAAVVAEQNARSVVWSLIADDFVGETLWADFGASFAAAHVEATDAALPTTSAELEACGERIWTLTRLFNVREGIGRADDSLPRPLSEPLADGPNAGARIDPAAFRDLLDSYYRARGWDASGRPTTETLDRLGLSDLTGGG